MPEKLRLVPVVVCVVPRFSLHSYRVTLPLATPQEIEYAPVVLFVPVGQLIAPGTPGVVTVTVKPAVNALHPVELQARTV